VLGTSTAACGGSLILIYNLSIYFNILEGFLAVLNAVIALISSFVFAASGTGKKNATNSVDMKALSEATAKYRQAKLVQMNLEKVVKSDLTGKENKLQGEISLSAGLFRLENKEPEKSLLVFDGKTLWNEQQPSADFGGAVQVTKTKLGGKNKSQTLFATLLTKDPVTKYFKILKSKKDDGVTVYETESLTADLTIKFLTLKIDNKSKLVSEISYKDDIGNLTTMKFSNAQFKNSLNKKIFEYHPPKGAQVTEI
jgi:outer membrane lipoprotein carrier protein